MDTYLDKFLEQLRRLPRGVVVLLFVVFVGLVIGAILLYSSLTFHVVSIDPPMETFPDYSPVIFVDFNHPLRSTTITTAFVPSVSTTYSIDKNRLTINLHSPLQDGKTYSLSITGLISTSGEKLGAQTYQFIPESIPLDQLSPEIQMLVMARQDKTQPVTRTSIQVIGDSSLTDQGLSLFQLDAFKQAIFLYGKSLNKTFTNVTIDANSIQPFLADPNQPDSVPSLHFALTIDSQKYQAVVDQPAVAVIRLLLNDPSTGATVYDSGNIDDTQLK